MTTTTTKLYYPTGIGLSVLDELDEVPWDQLDHAYGKGITGDDLHHDVAASLRELWDDPAEAFRALYANICHQGMTVYEATAFTVPFLAAIAAGEEDHRTPSDLRAELVILIAHIALASSYTTEDGSSAGSFGPNVAEDIRAALTGSNEHLEIAATHDEALRLLLERIAAIAKNPDDAHRTSLAHAVASATILPQERRRAAFVELHERQAKQKRTLEVLQVGAVVLGRVTAVTDYGVFIDVGGIDGLLHLTAFRDIVAEHPAEKFQRGDEVKVVVTEIDRGKERIRLGLAR
jgi:hypothetical protein